MENLTVLDAQKSLQENLKLYGLNPQQWWIVLEENLTLTSPPTEARLIKKADPDFCLRGQISWRQQKDQMKPQWLHLAYDLNT